MCEEKAECTKGFVLQIQQGVTQVAEEKQAKRLKVPRIAVISIEAASIHVGGVSRAKEYMETALVWPKTSGGTATLQLCSERFEGVDGGEQVRTDPKGLIHVHLAWRQRLRRGDPQHGKMHGKGKFPWPCLLSSWNSDVDLAVGMGVLSLAVLIAVRRRQSTSSWVSTWTASSPSRPRRTRPWPDQVHLARRRRLRWGDPTRQDARQGKVRLA